MLRDCGRKEMREELGVGMDVVADDIGAIYKMHGLKGRRHGGRRELAEKMGREFVGKREKKDGESAGGGVDVTECGRVGVRGTSNIQH